MQLNDKKALLEIQIKPFHFVPFDHKHKYILFFPHSYDNKAQIVCYKQTR